MIVDFAREKQGDEVNKPGVQRCVQQPQREEAKDAQQKAQGRAEHKVDHHQYRARRDGGLYAVTPETVQQIVRQIQRECAGQPLQDEAHQACTRSGPISIQSPKLKKRYCCLTASR